MKKGLTGCLLLLSAFLQAQEKLPKGFEHVIIIGVDGMSPDGIKKANTPVMHKLIANGAVKCKNRL